MAFKKVDTRQSFPKMEEEILKFWDENKIFEKSVQNNPEEKSFIFYEGPPTANGKPGLHHVLARAFKDVIPRYKTMKGFRVERKAGWDTHGLPVEIQVEKELGLKNKQDIENIVPGNPRESIIEFNKKCKESVWVYKDLWEKLTRRMGYWVDMQHPYVTYENSYIESVWWVIAQVAKLKNAKRDSLLYKGHRVIPYCYRCGTALSSHEVAQGYQTVKENSIYIKFKLKPGQKVGDFITDDKTYILAWTTTPWTLPGNVALAVGKDIGYVAIKQEKEQYILAKNRSGVIDEKHKIIREFPGDKLISLVYEPLYALTDKENVYKVVSGDFVSTEDGTGVVHIAPAFGEDDANVGKEYDLPTLITINEKGEMDADVPGKGIPVKKKNEKNRYAVDDLIIEDLKKRKLLFKEEEYEHEYPFCWRCSTPLIYYAKPSWFIRMSELSGDLVKNNEKINWIPEHIKEGRFGEWLRSNKDWGISRERYWGTPLPIWTCGKCDGIKVVESAKEIEELYGKKLDDLHKPFIDDVKLPCECGGEMVREKEVLDVWFDSGSMPTAQFNYPNGATEEDRKEIESGKFYPADYISEAIDQTRGWFYTLHAISTLLNKAGKTPAGYAYKNVICLGHILDAKGKKMSKSLGNIVEPMPVMDQYGADMLRWMLYTINQPGLPKRFDVKGMKDIMNRVFRMLWNSYSFFVMYANVDKWKPSASDKGQATGDKANLLDRWILSELNMLIKNVDEKLDSYDIYAAAKSIEKFIDNLSNWYIRRSRKRFWKSENDSDKNDAYATLHHVLVELSKLMAPFTPFVSEEIYKNLTGKESVHLAEFPVVDEKMIDEKLNEEMKNLREVISLGLQERAKAGIKVRQPIAGIVIKGKKINNELIEIAKDELNIKGINFNEEAEKDIELVLEFKSVTKDLIIKYNIEGNPSLSAEDLKLEGIAREIIRFIQEMRKQAGYEVENRINVSYQGHEKVFEKFDGLIAKETLANSVSKEALADFDLEKEFEIEGEKIYIRIKKA